MHKNISIAGTVTVGPKGQVVIPVDVRENMSIQPGDKLIVLYTHGKKAVSFVSEETVQSIVDVMGDQIRDLQSGLEDK